MQGQVFGIKLQTEHFCLRFTTRPVGPSTPRSWHRQDQVAVNSIINDVEVVDKLTRVLMSQHKLGLASRTAQQQPGFAKSSRLPSTVSNTTQHGHVARRDQATKLDPRSPTLPPSSSRGRGSGGRREQQSLEPPPPQAPAPAGARGGTPYNEELRAVRSLLCGQGFSRLGRSPGVFTPAGRHASRAHPPSQALRT